MSIGFGELVVIVIVAMFIFSKPEKLPEYVKIVQNTVSSIKSVSKQVKEDVKETVETINETVVSQTTEEEIGNEETGK